MIWILIQSILNSAALVKSKVQIVSFNAVKIPLFWFDFMLKASELLQQVPNFQCKSDYSLNHPSKCPFVCSLGCLMLKLYGTYSPVLFNYLVCLIRELKHRAGERGENKLFFIYYYPSNCKFPVLYLYFLCFLNLIGWTIAKNQNLQNNLVNTVCEMCRSLLVKLVSSVAVMGVFLNFFGLFLRLILS